MQMTCLILATFASVLMSWPSPTTGQPATKVYQVGVLGTREGPSTPALRQGFRELGYVEGRNIAITYRWSEGNVDRLPALAAELVNLKMDLIVASGTSAAVAAKEATSTIPVVFTLVADPVELGLVASLPRPGSNVTGLSAIVQAGPFTQKQLELLKEMVPGASRIAVLRNPANASEARRLSDTMTAGAKLGVTIQVLEARVPEDIDRAFEAARRGRAGAIHVHGDPMLGRHQTRIVALAATHRLPAMYFSSESVLAGGLMSYGPNIEDLLRRVGGYADRILKGARPGDLPVEQPTRFDLFINLKTASELGVVVPRSLLLRADHVVE